MKFILIFLFCMFSFAFLSLAVGNVSPWLSKAALAPAFCMCLVEVVSELFCDSNFNQLTLASLAFQKTDR